MPFVDINGAGWMSTVPKRIPEGIAASTFIKLKRIFVHQLLLARRKQVGGRRHRVRKSHLLLAGAWEAILPMSKASFPLMIFLLCVALVPARAQSRMEAGLFLDYLNVSQTRTPNLGLGGRFGYRVHSHVMAEAELNYDYGVNFNELYVNIANGNTAAIERTSIGVTDGLFGPMLQPARGHFRPFVTLKGGFIDFRLSPGLLPYGNVVSSVLGIRTSNVNAALYPGAGAEASLGPLGLRLEFGDLVYFNGGGHNNLRITFGPIVRF
jgi:hypothetical protein